MRKTILFVTASVFSATCVHAALDDSAATKEIGSIGRPQAGHAQAGIARELPSALSVDQIVSRNAAARGGLEAWQRIQTLSMSGQIDAGKRRVDGGRVATVNRKLSKGEVRAQVLKAMYGKAEKTDNTIRLPFEMELKRPLMSRVELQFRGDTAVQVYDGTQGWKLRPFIGRHEVEAFNADELKAASQQQQLDGPLLNYAAKGTKLALDGSEAVEGRNAYKLSLTLKTGEVRHLWIDAASFLEVKMEGEPRRIDGRLRAVTTTFRDYRPVDGLMIARVLETAVAGIRDIEQIHVDKIVLNPPLDDSRFAKPR